MKPIESITKNILIGLNIIIPIFSLILLALLFISLKKSTNTKVDRKEFFNDETMKSLSALKYDFLPNQNGYFQIGSFLLQWGISQASGGKSVTNKDENPVIAFGMFVAIGITMAMMQKREGYDTAVPMNIDFDEIYGAHTVPYGEKDRVVYENMKVKEMSPNRIIVRVGNYHAPFLWFAYGLRVRSDDDESNNRSFGGGSAFLENELQTGMDSMNT